MGHSLLARGAGTAIFVAVWGLALLCSDVRADTSEPALRLVSVTAPAGSSDEAETARGLVPEATKDSYRISHISALPSVKRADIDELLSIAAKRAEKAKEAALAFDLVLAATLRRQAADDLIKTEALAIEPSVVAKYSLEAGAASVDAGEEDLALLYYRRALAIDSEILPGPSISPRAKEVFDTAQNQGPERLDTPHSRILIKLCTALEVDGIVWISVGRDSGGMVVSEKLLLLNENLSEPETLHHPPSGEGLHEWSAREKKRLATVILTKLPREPEPVPKPWYKKWWIYAVAGGVIAAGAVAGVVVADAVQPKEVDVVVHH